MQLWADVFRQVLIGAEDSQELDWYEELDRAKEVADRAAIMIRTSDALWGCPDKGEDE